MRGVREIKIFKLLNECNYELNNNNQINQMEEVLNNKIIDNPEYRNQCKVLS